VKYGKQLKGHEPNSQLSITVSQKEPRLKRKASIMSKKMSITRILKLAELHGPFARFSPEGNEAVDDAIKDAENADLKDNKEFDKVRQQAQQFEANATKSREAAEAATAQLTTANSQVESLKAQLDEANAKASAGNVNVELDEKDYSDTDLALVRSIKAIQKQVETKDVELKALAKKATDFETNRATTDAKVAQEERYQELLSDMDVDYGPEYRNAAVTAFDAKVAAGEVTGGPAKATRILEKCYKDAVSAAKAKDAKNEKEGVRLDSGSGGGGGESLSGVELTAGSLEDVTAQAGKLLNKTGT
jgi:chromosome segregation ATPase